MTWTYIYNIWPVLLISAQLGECAVVRCMRHDASFWAIISPLRADAKILCAVVVATGMLVMDGSEVPCMRVTGSAIKLTHP